MKISKLLLVTALFTATISQASEIENTVANNKISFCYSLYEHTANITFVDDQNLDFQFAGVYGDYSARLKVKDVQIINNEDGSSITQYSAFEEKQTHDGLKAFDWTIKLMSSGLNKKLILNTTGWPNVEVGSTLGCLNPVPR